jgi:hypothetical protein
MKTLLTLLLLLASGPAFADKPAPPPPLTDQDLNESIDMGEEIESRVFGDINMDGFPDAAYIVFSPDRRELFVLGSNPGNAELPYSLIGKTELMVYPLGPADMSISDKGVLTVEDLTGGTSAMQSIFKYRWDKEKLRLRLIGLDATYYSRTWAHGGWEMSWNLLTHKMITAELELQGEDKDVSERNYEKKFEQTFEWLSNPIWIEDTPDPEMVYIETNKK